MKKVFIKYNPYKVETEITVDGKKLAQNSKLREKIEPGSQLQEWVEELPQILIDEYNDIDFDIRFHGTLFDFEDLTEVFKLAHEKGQLTAKLDRKPAKEIHDKEGIIDDVFKEIQKGPFEELKDSKIINTFHNTKTSDFEVYVVSTMNTDKSTLINAMLGTKLIPSKQESCTANITRIKHTNDYYTSWKAKAYNKDGEEIESHENLTYDTMKKLNNNKNISLIEINGNIPFVSSDNVSLVLINTPDLNNPKDLEHKKFQSEFLSKSSKSLVLYIMEGTFDYGDNALLQCVTDSMKVGGKQSKDRFIFVVNKMNNHRKEYENIEQALGRIREHLKKHGIINPNLFPVAALTALNIRLIASSEEIDEDTLDETEMKVRKLNRDKAFHLEKYTLLPLSICEYINEQICEAKNEYEEALIHTDIVTIEALISQYVKKYEETVKIKKIKNIVDTSLHKFNEIGCFKEIKRELTQNRNERDLISAHIEKIEKNIEDVKSAQKFKNTVDDTLLKVNNEVEDDIENILQKYQEYITNYIDSLREKELYFNKAMEEILKLEKSSRKFERDLMVDLDEFVRKKLISTGNSLLIEYKNKLTSLTEKTKLISFSEIIIEPLRFTGSSIKSGNVTKYYSLIKQLTQFKKIENGKEWVKDKDMFDPFNLLQFDVLNLIPKKGHYRKKYKTVEYINASKLAQELLAPIEENLYITCYNAISYASKQSNKIARVFNEEFKCLDDVLKSKSEELESFTTEKKKIEERIRESESRLAWLEAIKAKVESIIEI